MPKVNKRTKQSREAIKKHWKQKKSFKEIVLELLDAEPDEFNESQFGNFWIEGKETHFDSDEIMDGM